MSPYYEREGIRLFKGDCREVLPTLGKHWADMLATDPPWGVAWESGFRAESFGVMAGDDNEAVARAGLAAAIDCLGNRKHIYVFGPESLLEGLPVGGKSDLVWDKEILGSGNLSAPWGPSHERITFGACCKSAANRANGDGRLAARLRRGSVLRHKRPNSTGVRHPSEKPVALMRELIESSSCFGDTVLDPFAGSGSTLVAALLEGRKAVGVEVEEKWCEMIAGRLDAAMAKGGAA